MKMSVSIAIIPYLPSNPYQDLFINELRRRGNQVYTFQNLSELCLHIKVSKQQPDIVHLHWMNIGLKRFVGVFWRILKVKAKGICIVWTVHNLIPHDCPRPRLLYFLRYLLARLVSRIFVHSQAAKELIAQKWHLNSKNIGIVPHPHYVGVYPDSTSRQRAESILFLKSRKVRFLFIGAIRAYKQVPLLIESFKRMNINDTELLVCGQIHPDETQLARTITESIANRHNIILQNHFIEDGDIQHYMHVADAVVFPYGDTLCSGAAILAMSFGKACIAPNTIAFESILDEQGAFLFDYTEHDALTLALQKAYDNHQRLAQMGKWNRQKISKLTPALCTSQLLKQYCRCCPVIVV